MRCSTLLRVVKPSSGVPRRGVKLKFLAVVDEDSHYRIDIVVRHRMAACDVPLGRRRS